MSPTSFLLNLAANVCPSVCSCVGWKLIDFLIWNLEGRSSTLYLRLLFTPGLVESYDSVCEVHSHLVTLKFWSESLFRNLSCRFHFCNFWCIDCVCQNNSNRSILHSEKYHHKQTNLTQRVYSFPNQGGVRHSTHWNMNTTILKTHLRLFEMDMHRNIQLRDWDNRMTSGYSKHHVTFKLRCPIWNVKHVDCMGIYVGKWNVRIWILNASSG